MNSTLKAFISKVSTAEANELLVSLASEAMKEKLSKVQDNHAVSWHVAGDRDALTAALLEQLGSENPDMVDVMNYAAMIYVIDQLGAK